MGALMIGVAHPRSAARGFTLVETLAALAIVAMAVLVAAAFLQAHATAARRLEVRSALVHATETTLEELRSGVRPLVSATLDLGPEYGLAPGASMRTSIKVATGGVADLFHVVVTSRSSESGEPMEIVIETMVWRP
jgi:prepilin-type N-terminal cleavage/methylation domain-containing protein